jgi:hypothetical protein
MRYPMFHYINYNFCIQQLQNNYEAPVFVMAILVV